MNDDKEIYNMVSEKMREKKLQNIYYVKKVFMYFFLDTLKCLSIKFILQNAKV